MGLYSIYVVNTAPGCDNSIVQQLNVTGCTNYILRLASNSNAIGPFNVYLNAISTPNIIYSALTRSQILGGVQITFECTLTPTPTQTATPQTPTPTPTNTSTPPLPSNTPTTTPTVTSTPTTTPSVTPTISVTPSNTPTQGLSPTPTATITTTPTPSITSSQTPTPSITATPTPSPNYYVAYLFPEPLDSTSQADLGQYMFDNGAMWYGFGNSGGVPNLTDYQTDMDLYVHYSGWNGSSGSFVTAVTSLTGSIRQASGTGTDSYGCVQNQYTFGTIAVSASMVNPAVQYNYTVWLPLAGLGGTFNNMTVDVGNSICGSAIYDNAIPEPGLAAANVVVSSGAAIPAGTYRVLWNFTLPPTTPLNYTLYFKGDTKT